MHETAGYSFGKARFSGAAVLFLLAACVTINIYFPAAEVRKAADTIVKEVRGDDAAAMQQDAPASHSGTGPVSLAPLASNAWAGDELTVSNANIRSLKNRIKSNYPALRNWLVRGVIGEDANGYVALRSEQGLNLKEKMDVRRIMNEENANRRALYKAVAAALNIPPSEVRKVGRIFATRWQQSVPAGAWVETSPGNWVRR